MEKEFNFNFSFKVQVPQFIVAAWQGRGRVVRGLLRQMVPNVGTVLVTTLLVTALIYAQSVGAVPWAQSLRQTGGSSTTTINYQGRLADSAGEPIEGNVGMEFALYDAQTGGTLLWGPETHGAVPVSDGLFSVKLGSVEEGGIPASILGGDVWLEVMVGGETLAPRERLGAVPYALQALVAKTLDTANIPDVGMDTGGIAFNDEDGETLRIDGNEIDSTGDLHIQREHQQQVYVHAGLDVSEDISISGLNFKMGGGTALRYDDGRYLYLLPWGGSEYRWDAVCIGCATGADLIVRGSLTHEALIEANLQTPTELAAPRIDRFSEGDVLCWAEERLEKCATAGDLLVQAVADENGKPIVIGAEVIKVIGPVQRGDLLVASEVTGYAMASEAPAPGAVIAQALADFTGERGVVKAMIRKF